VGTLTTALHVRPDSPHWPPELAEIEGQPEELWLRGKVELLASRPRVAIVGTRAPTPYGESQAQRFAMALAEAGLTIVSGMARGIDHAAHSAALRVGGGTIAVLGSGVDRPWPAGELADAIARDGLLLSEFQPGEPPRPHHFPLRNRVISGLSVGVLIIEAAHASGSLITARWAADQGRNVYALPGRVDHPMSRGAHRLIREGAMLVESPDEIVRDLLGASAMDRSGEGPAPTAPVPEAARRILVELNGETLTSEEISLRLARPLPAVLVDLVALEMAGSVVRGPGGAYRLAHRGL
jgi:DNA processing protein